LTEPSALVVAAAANNAHWCRIVCAAHHAASEIEEDFWICRGTAPPLYPNLVTLGGSAPARQAAQLRALDALQSLDGLEGWAVKDSFRALDLTARGFEILFEASWLVREPDAATNSPLAATIVADGVELAAWEEAWRQEEEAAELPPRFFPETLLADPDIAFVAIRRDGRIVAGAAVNRAAGVAGLTNLFAGSEATDAVAASVAAAIAVRFPGMPIVDYETADRARDMQGAGFRPLAPLAVWLAP
jgi:hypothetical protein